MPQPQPVVVTKVPPSQIQVVMQAYGPGFTFDVRPDGAGTFTVTVTPVVAAAGAVEFAALATGGPLPAPAAEEPDDYTTLLPLPPKSTFNVGLASAGAHRLRQIFGEPILGARYDPDGKCRAPDNPSLTQHIVTKQLGPISATGVRVAVDALAGILSQVEGSRPRLYALLGTAGMACARFTKIKGRIGPNVSTHSWGMAIDLTIGGKTDAQGDDKVMRGSLELARFFNQAEWYWGAGFPIEDGMHFEASASLIEKWKATGQI